MPVVPPGPHPARRQLLRAAVATGLLGTLGPVGVARAELPRLIDAARASVLPIGTFRATDSPRFGFRGTGYVIGDGTLLATCFHVLPAAGEGDGTEPALVALVGRTEAGGQLRRLRVLATDRPRDLALLRIEGPPLAALALAEAGTGREGQSVALMGFPIGGTLGYALVTHRGIISSLTTAALPAATAQQLDPRAVARLREGNFEIFQLDATAYPGNSGGPLVDAATGLVLGTVNMVLVKAGRESALSQPTGISYAIPGRHLHELIRSATR